MYEPLDVLSCMKRHACLQAMQQPVHTSVAPASHADSAASSPPADSARASSQAAAGAADQATPSVPPDVEAALEAVLEAAAEEGADAVPPAAPAASADMASAVADDVLPAASASLAVQPAIQPELCNGPSHVQPDAQLQECTATAVPPPAPVSSRDVQPPMGEGAEARYPASDPPAAASSAGHAQGPALPAVPLGISPLLRR